MNSYFISWYHYQEMIMELVRQIKKSGKRYRQIFAIPRGGLPVATSLAHKLSVERITVDRNDISEDTLVVDDICDTGETLSPFKDYDIACLCYSPQSMIKVTYYSEKIGDNTWVVFPWEELTEPKRRSRDDV